VHAESSAGAWITRTPQVVTLRRRFYLVLLRSAVKPSTTANVARVDCCLCGESCATCTG
jgi:hypothetical protein